VQIGAYIGQQRCRRLRDAGALEAVALIVKRVPRDRQNAGQRGHGHQAETSSDGFSDHDEAGFRALRGRHCKFHLSAVLNLSGATMLAGGLILADQEAAWIDIFISNKGLVLDVHVARSGVLRR
jgi:hypothetical protein